MNKKDWVEGMLFAGFRILAVACLLIGLLGMVFRMLDAWYRLDPNYLGTFLADTLLRPFLVFLTGLILYGFSGRLSRRMASGYNRWAP